MKQFKKVINIKSVRSTKIQTPYRYRTLSVMHTCLATLAFCVSTLIGASAWAADQPQFIIVGTAGVTGVYYPMGGAVCRMMNRTRKEHGIRCSVESTRGSVANLNTMGDGELDFAVAQSDAQYHAYNGTDVFTELGPNKELRSVFALHPEPFTVVARADAGINTFDDLQGKRINIGNPGSGHRETMEALMQAKGWSKTDFSLVSELSSVEHSRALCDNKIDAYVFAVGHPAGSIKEAANTCEVIIVSVTGAEVDKLVRENSYYTNAVVPGGMYRGTESEVSTFGVSAALMSSSTTDPNTVYLLVKNVFTNLNTMKKMHPAFSMLSVESMAKNSPSIPMHEGAIRYFKEAGLQK